MCVGRLFCGCFLVIGIFSANAQTQLATFSSNKPDTVWKPEVFAFLRNTEFFHPAEEGRTRFGALIGARRSYYGSGGRTVELGGWVQQNFGTAPKLLPWVVLRQSGRWGQASFGSIADRSHGLPRQLINPDLRYAEPIVYGLSGLLGRGSFRADYWAEWLTAIDYGSPKKERIHVGTLLGWEVPQAYLKAFLQYHHTGGQIDTSPEVDGNRLNGGAIARLRLGPAEVRLAHVLYADPLARFSPERRGNGTAADLSVRATSALRIEASYWRGRNFQAPLGQGLFQSRNPEDLSAWYAEDRRLVGLSLGWEGQSSLRIRAWYDLTERSLQPSVTWVRYVVLDPL